MRKISYLSASILSILVLSTTAKAESNVDARSVGLGGTTIGQANNAFAPLRNPASMVDIGSMNFMLPISPVLSIGNTAKPINAFTGLIGSKDMTAGALDIVSGFFQTDSSRLEVQSTLPILGFSGSPFKNVNIMGKPVAFGLNLWGRAVANVNFNSSKGIGELLANSPTLFNSFTEIQKQSAEISSSLAGVTNLTIPNLQNFQNINPTNQESVNVAISEVETFQKNSLKPLIASSDTAVNSISKLTDDLKNVLTKFDDISKNSQTGKGNIIADGHAVVAVSSGAQVFSNEMVDISLGLNFKGFFFPANNNYSAINNSSNPNPVLTLLGGDQGANKLIPVTVNTEIQTGAFKSIADIKNVIDTKLSPVVQSAKDLVTTAKTLDGQLDTTIPKAKENFFSALGDATAIQGTVNTLVSQSNTIKNNLSTDFSKNLVTDIQNSLANDLKDVKININQMTDVAPFGFGLDIGAQAKIMDNIVLGLVVENPLVLWPAKMKKNQLTFDQSKLQASAGQSNIQLTNLFSIIEDKNPQSTNYNLSEPLAIRFGGSYNLSKLSPHLSNTSILGDVEQVFNGRPFAAHLGIEKGWTFGSNAVFARLGTQLGGLGNMFTLGLGAKGGPFNISLGYGASNPFNPMGSNNAILGLSTSLSF